MDPKNVAIVLTKTTAADKSETPEECTERLSRQLAELTRIDNEGKAKQLRKERDVERILNTKLRKEVDKLSNTLLCQRTKVSSLEKEVKTLAEKIEDQTTEPNDLDESANGECFAVHDSLTLKLRQFKTAIEERMEGQRNVPEKEDEFIALSILIQSLQNYLQVEGDQDTVTDVVDNKPHISIWFKLVVYLGPIFLSFFVLHCIYNV